MKGRAEHPAAPPATPATRPAQTAPPPLAEEQDLPSVTLTPASTTSKPQARLVTKETDTACKGETYDKMLGWQAAECNAAHWLANHSKAPAGKATDTPATMSTLTEVERLDLILNAAPGPLSGPGPCFVTKERCAELDAEHMTVYMSNGELLSVWKANIQSTPLPNAVIITTEHNPINALPRLDEQNA